MLVLSRRVGETLMIGNDVTLTILRIKGKTVRVGINAPQNVAVHREELYERLTGEGTSASRPAKRLAAKRCDPDVPMGAVVGQDQTLESARPISAPAHRRC